MSGSGGHVYDPAHLRLALEVAGVGAFDWDLRTGALAWDDALLELFGYDEAEFDGTIASFNARLHPDDLPRVSEALGTAIDTCGPYEAEYRVVRPDGVRWVRARGRALQGEDGSAARVIGVALDLTEVREGQSRVARILESMSAAFFALGRDFRFLYVNAEAERLLGHSRAELLGGDIWELFPAAVGTEFETQYRGAMSTGEPTSFEAYYPAPLSAWYEVRVWPDPDGLAVYFLDITARRAASERARLLTEATSELSETLDPQEAVSRLAALLVPTLADWVIVTLVNAERSGDWRRDLRDVRAVHADARLQPVLERYVAGRLEALSDAAFLPRALDAGEPVVVRDATNAIARVLEGEQALAALHELAPQSGVIQPLRARGRTLALLTVGWGHRDPRQEDLDTLAELAGRVGLVLDNARLYDEQRQLAEALQRSLLTAPPEPDHMEVVVRYKPAAQAAQVGGDWYDAFLQRGGATVLVIGDVVGHDVDAAAAMGQVRGLLRGIAATTGEGPAAVLTRLDEAMELLLVGTTATAVVARFEQTPDERSHGLTRVVWSNAGHPPPLLVDEHGRVTVLDGQLDPGTDDADLLLGMDPTTRRGERVVTVGRPATFVLYTDGLVEQRGQSIDEGLERLEAVVAELADLPLTELCDRLLERMLPERPEDDVALTAVRLHTLDQPRPPEAGPQVVPPRVPAPLGP